MRRAAPLSLLALVLACAEEETTGPGQDGGVAERDGGSSGQDGGIIRPDLGPNACPHRAERPLPSAEWAPTGPPGGSVTALLALEEGVVLAGTSRVQGAAGRPSRASKLYRSADQGASLEIVQDFGDAVISALARTPGAKIYAAVGATSGSGDDGVWVSEDRGQSFTRDNGGLHAGARVRTLIAHGTSPDRVYALVEGSPSDPLAAVVTLYRKDGSAPWTALSASGVDPSPGGPVTGIALHPSDRNTVFLADGARFYVSEDAGDNFSGSEFGLAFEPSGLRDVIGLYVDPAIAERILVATSNAGIYESEDGGAVWTRVLSVPPVGVLHVAFSAGRTFAATDGAGLFVSSGSGFVPTGACLVDPVVSRVTLAPDDPSLAFAGSLGAGLFRSSDGAEHFAPQSAGMDELMGRVVVTGSAESPTAWLASAAGLYRMAADRAAFERIGGQAGTLAFADVAVSSEWNGAILTATNEDLFRGGGSGRGVLTVSPTDEVRAASGLPGRNVASLVLSPLSASTVFAYQLRGTREHPDSVQIGVYRSEDRGQSFTRTNITSYDTFPSHPFVMPSSPLAIAQDGTLYAGILRDNGAGGFFRALVRSEDGGETVTTLWSDEDDPDTSKTVNGVYLSPSGDLFLVGRAGGARILRSSAGGPFEPFEDGLPASISSVLDLSFGPDGAVAVATSRGVYVAPSGGSFRELGEGFDGPTPVIDVSYLPGSPPLLFASTVDRGIVVRTAP